MDLQLWLTGQFSEILSAEPPAITADLFEHGFDRYVVRNTDVLFASSLIIL